MSSHEDYNDYFLKANSTYVFGYTKNRSLIKESNDWALVMEAIQNDCGSAGAIALHRIATYSNRTNFTATQPIHIKGENWGRTIIQQKEVLADAMLTLEAAGGGTYGEDGAQVSGLTFDADLKAQDGVWIHRARQRVNDIGILDATQDGLTFYHATDSILGTKIGPHIRITVPSTGRYGLNVGTHAGDSEIFDVLCRNDSPYGAEAGLNLEDCSGMRIVLYHGWGFNHTVKLGGTLGSAQRVQIACSELVDGREHGINCEDGGGWGVTIVGCDIKKHGQKTDNTYDALHVDSGSNLQNAAIVGNVFYGYWGSGNYSRYVANNEGTDARVVFVGNDIHDTSFHGTAPLIRGFNSVTNEFRANGGLDFLEYQEQSGSWAAPTDGCTFNGRRVTVYNSTQAAYRIYFYANGGWHYITATA